MIIISKKLMRENVIKVQDKGAGNTRLLFTVLLEIACLQPFSLNFSFCCTYFAFELHFIK